MNLNKRFIQTGAVDVSGRAVAGVSILVLRTARRDISAGTAFWGCATFPACRGIVKQL